MKAIEDASMTVSCFFIPQQKYIQKIYESKRTIKRHSKRKFDLRNYFMYFHLFLYFMVRIVVSCLTGGDFKVCFFLCWYTCSYPIV